MNGYKIKREARSNVVTFAPPVLGTFGWTCGSFNARVQGYGAATLFKQRARRWTVTKLRRMIWTMVLVVFYRGGSLWNNTWFRLSYMFQVFGAIATVYYLPLFLLRQLYDVATHPSGDASRLLFASLAFVVVLNYAIQIFEWLAINYGLWSRRPDFQVSLGAVLALPALHIYLNFCELIGHSLAIWHWIPFVPTNVWHFARPHDAPGRTAASMPLKAKGEANVLGEGDPIVLVDSIDAKHKNGTANKNGAANGVAHGGAGSFAEGRYQLKAVLLSGVTVLVLGGLLALEASRTVPPPGYLAAHPAPLPHGRMVDGRCALLNHTDGVRRSVAVGSPVAASFLHVIGWPRSGSTLLAAVLDAHPAMSIANEYDTLAAFVDIAPAADPLWSPLQPSALPGALPHVAELAADRLRIGHADDMLEAAASSVCADCPSADDVACAVLERTTSYRKPPSAADDRVCRCAREDARCPRCDLPFKRAPLFATWTFRL